VIIVSKDQIGWVKTVLVLSIYGIISKRL